ncbi:MAG: winged helix DNA-binding domain-containing protein [Chloroflexi bacterium]|nr:winged helix DNA-binding domain-containing protein [Chloroflexota bacterium]
MRNPGDVARLRLNNQLLAGNKSLKPGEAVQWMGALQAQDYAAAKWSLGLRMQNADDEDIENAFNDGAILRTHVMRPTWHFVMPEDIRWMLELTAPRVKSLLAHYDRRLELTRELLSRCGNTVTRALQGGHYLTRAELASCLEENGIEARGQRLAHIVMHAELDGLICSGPRRGKQFTYALLDERASECKQMSRDEARATLALRYFSSHGPAQLKDFAWWSGLSASDAQEALDSVASMLAFETLDSKTYYFPPAQGVAPESPAAFLLSIYDEYTIAYKDRGDISDGRDIERMISMGNALTAVMIMNGKVAGTWKRVLKRNTVEIALQPFRELSESEKEAFESEVARYGKFLGVSAALI